MIDFDKIKQEVGQRLGGLNSSEDPLMAPPPIGL
jgi:hypothetical protein